MASNPFQPHISGGRINRIFMVAPLACSVIALAIVMGNLAAGVPPEADEGTAAHLFQLLMFAQVPLAIGFAATAKWKRPTRPLLVLATQALAFGVALGSLAWSGY